MMDFIDDEINNLPYDLAIKYDKRNNKTDSNYGSPLHNKPCNSILNDNAAIACRPLEIEPSDCIYYLNKKDTAFCLANTFHG